MNFVEFNDLSGANLIVDAVYQSDRTDKKSSYGSEPLHHLIPGVATAAGFRKKMGTDGTLVGLLLTSTGAESDWPDELDPYTGTYTYYGDNRQPGRELHKTKFLGNLELSKMFALAHGDKDDRTRCPLILIFHSGVTGRDMVFKGMAVPGTNYLSRGEDLVAIWRVTKGERFQNYRASFTILDTGEISGDWVREVFNSRKLDLRDPRVPKAFLQWIETRKYQALTAERDKSGRTVKEQLPRPGISEDLINCILDTCKADPYTFEPIAAGIWKLSCLQPMDYELTRRYRDGGRDAVGYLTLGPLADPIKVSFALEAKCYSPTNRVGVKETSRLISRIKHREFGVLVTTSAVDPQAYQEIRQDGHPIVIIAGQDIADILIKCGINSVSALKEWIGSLNV
jgi:hypothetical protein